MSDISDLENRLSAAMERIGRGVETLSDKPPEADPQELEDLRQALEAEKHISAEMQERIAEMETQHAAEIAELKEADSTRDESILELDLKCQRIKNTNQKLRENNRNLRESNQKNISDPGLINASLQAELDGLRAMREAEAAEAAAIISELMPLLQEDTGADHKTLGDA